MKIIIKAKDAKVDDTNPIANKTLDKNWELLKKVIDENNIGSLEELQDYFSTDVIKITRGRFITLESGEIISEYPQWEVLDDEKFRKFAKYYYSKSDYKNSDPTNHFEPKSEREHVNDWSLFE